MLQIDLQVGVKHVEHPVKGAMISRNDQRGDFESHNVSTQTRNWDNEGAGAEILR